MNIDNYREFLERIGHRVVESESGCWFNAGPRFYESIPPFALISPPTREVWRLLWGHHMVGIKYYAEMDKAGKPSFLYVCEDKSYDLSRLGRQTRRKIRKGLRRCQVRRIDSEYLHAHGMPLNLDTLARQRRSDSNFDNPAGWRGFCEAAGQVEGAVAWGVFVDDELAAYTLGFVIDGYVIYLYQMSRTGKRSLYVNHVLTHVATRDMLALSHVHCVSQGHETIRDLPGLDMFKVRLGYKKRPLRQVVKLHPLVKPVFLSSAGRLALHRLRRRYPCSDPLICAKGIIDIARHCYND